MIHSLNCFHVADFGPPIPASLSKRAKCEPQEEQRAHPFCILLLKGMQTRFYDSEAAFNEADAWLFNKARRRFQYSEERKQYLEITQ